MAYCTYTDVRLVSGLTTNEIADADITSLIAYATTQFNAEVNIRIDRERVEYLDTTRQNKIDSSNTTYYVKNWNGWYLGDLNDDGSISVSDAKFYYVATDGTETEKTISSITHDTGKIVLSAAPATSGTGFITYSKAPIDLSTPNNLVKKAMSELTAALAFTKTDAKKLKNFRVGKIAITTQSEGFKTMYEQYRRTLELIQNRMGSQGEWK